MDDVSKYLHVICQKNNKSYEYDKAPGALVFKIIYSVFIDSVIVNVYRYFKCRSRYIHLLLKASTLMLMTIVYPGKIVYDRRKPSKK